MCSIWGIGLLNGCTLKNASTIKKLVRNFCAAGEERGTDATGVAVVSDKNIAVAKAAMRGENFARSKMLSDMLEEHCGQRTSRTGGPIIIIGHNRAQTKGHRSNNNNNHPIIASDVIGTHNGMILNDDELFKSKCLPRAGRVDSEIIFRLLDHKLNIKKLGDEKALQETASALQGSFSFAAVNSNNPFMFYLARGTSPLELRVYKRLGIFIYASTDTIITNAIRDALAKSEPYRNIFFSSQTAMTINMCLNNYRVIDIKDTFGKSHGAY